MNRNLLTFKSIENYKFDFKKLLNNKTTILWKNCDNLEIIIKSKINKLIFFNCTNIKLIFKDAIIGLEFERCNDINIELIQKTNLNSIEVFKSTLNFYNLNKINTFLLSEKSKINYNLY